MGKKRKPGRPVLAKSKAKGATIIVRLSKKERLAIESKAKRSRIKLSNWVRSALIAKLANDNMDKLPHGAEDGGIQPIRGVNHGS